MPFIPAQLSDHLRRLRQHYWPDPPPLAEPFSREDYRQFMRQETFIFSTRYARQRVVIHDRERLLKLARRGSVITVFLHQGSWILTGGAIAHQLRLPYTVIASRRNLEGLNPREQQFWRGVHERSSALYGNTIYYSDQSPRGPLKWLQSSGHVLGLALDVREINQQQRESTMTFSGTTLYMQCSPARLACIAKVPLLPTSIHYHPRERRHHLHIQSPIWPDGDPQEMTQRALNQLETYVAQYPEQQFHDIRSVFGTPYNC